MGWNSNCSNPEAYQRLLLGVAPPAEAQELSSHLEDCNHCCATVQSLLERDTIANQLATEPTLPNDSHPLPMGLVERLLTLGHGRPAGEVTIDLLSARVDTTDDPLSSSVVQAHDEKTLDHPGSRQGSSNENDLSRILLPPQEPGELGRLGSFIIRKVIGQGGMGVVFLADDPRLDRSVALKVIRPNGSDDQTSKKRFLAEARSAAKIKSDHVVTIFEIGEANGTVFVAMELLTGVSLADSLSSNAGLPAAEILRIAREIAAGLHSAHEKGLIHRDIKPDNIWLESPNSRVKILDFGLARPIEREVQFTNAGMVVGTPSYMPPEQASGHRVDARGDLFSLGCVLYRLCTGRLPFQGDSVLAVLNALATTVPPRIRTLNPGIPAPLDDLVARLLAKDPSARPQTAREVVEEIRRIEAAPVVPAAGPKSVPAIPPPPVEPDSIRRRRKGSFGGMIALSLLFLIGVSAIAYRFVFTNKDGTLVVEVDNEADVRFKNGKLEIRNEKGDLQYTLEPSERNKQLPPGKYLVKVVGADGVRLETEAFEIERKGKAAVKVKAIESRAAIGDLKKADNPAATTTTGSSGIILYFSDLGAVAPAPKLDVQKPWTVEAYLTPLNDNLAKTNCTVVGCDQGFGIGVFEGKYFVYSNHGKTSAGEVKAGERVHIACVQTETSRTMFLNGKLAASTDNSFPIANTALGKLEFRLANYIPNSPRIEVLVEEVRLSQAARYPKDFTPQPRFEPDQQTLVLYHCDEGTGSQLTDSSANKNHAKIIQAKWPNPPTGSAITDADWMKAIATLPAENQVQAVYEQLRKRNPEFIGTSEFNRHAIENGIVVGLEIDGKVTDLTPLRALTRLRKLMVRHLMDLNSISLPLTDLSPLNGMPLTELTLAQAKVSDLSPLKGVPLRQLTLFGTNVSELTPLADMPLDELVLRESLVSDLTPIRRLKLKSLNLYGTQVRDLSAIGGMPLETLVTSSLTTDLGPLRGMKLKELQCFGKVTDITALKGMPLEALLINENTVSDLAPLEGMPLKKIQYPFDEKRDGTVLRALKMLETVNGQPAKDVLK
jgi:serine/threonine protein kinase